MLCGDHSLSTALNHGTHIIMRHAGRLLHSSCFLFSLACHSVVLLPVIHIYSLNSVHWKKKDNETDYWCFSVLCGVLSLGLHPWKMDLTKTSCNGDNCPRHATINCDQSSCCHWWNHPLSWSEGIPSHWTHPSCYHDHPWDTYSYCFGCYGSCLGMLWDIYNNTTCWIDEEYFKIWSLFFLFFVVFCSLQCITRAVLLYYTSKMDTKDWMLMLIYILCCWWQLCTGCSRCDCSLERLYQGSHGQMDRWGICL